MSAETGHLMKWRRIARILSVQKSRKMKAAKVIAEKTRIIPEPLINLELLRDAYIFVSNRAAIT